MPNELSGSVGAGRYIKTPRQARDVESSTHGQNVGPTFNADSDALS